MKYSTYIIFMSEILRKYMETWFEVFTLQERWITVPNAENLETKYCRDSISVGLKPAGSGAQRFEIPNQPLISYVFLDKPQFLPLQKGDNSRTYFIVFMQRIKWDKTGGALGRKQSFKKQAWPYICLCFLPPRKPSLDYTPPSSSLSPPETFLCPHQDFVLLVQPST